MISFITPSLLQYEYDHEWIQSNDDLKQYIDWGYLTPRQYNKIINHIPVTDN